MSRRLGLMLTSEKKVASKQWLSALPCKTGLRFKLLAFWSRRETELLFTPCLISCAWCCTRWRDRQGLPQEAHSPFPQAVAKMRHACCPVTSSSQSAPSKRFHCKTEASRIATNLAFPWAGTVLKAEEFSLNHSVHQTPWSCPLLATTVQLWGRMS